MIFGAHPRCWFMVEYGVAVLLSYCKKKKNPKWGLLRNRLSTLLFKTPTKTEEKFLLIKAITPTKLGPQFQEEPRNCYLTLSKYFFQLRDLTKVKDISLSLSFFLWVLGLTTFVRSFKSIYEKR